MKINSELVNKVKKSTEKIVKVSFNIEDTEYIVNVDVAFTLAHKQKLMQEMMKITEEQINIYGEQTIGLLVALKTLTDIEWTDKLEDDVELLLVLNEVQVINKILDVVPEPVFKEMKEFAEEIAELNNKLLEEERATSKK